MYINPAGTNAGRILISGSIVSGMIGNQAVSSGNIASGSSYAFTNLPAADKYMYMAVGSAGGAPGTYTAGQFLIELYGV